MAELIVDIVTPEKQVFSGPADEIRVPGHGGEFGVLPDHTLFLSLVRPGIASVVAKGATKRFVVGSGFAEAGPDRVVILTDACEDAATVDKAAAQVALEAAGKALEEAEPGSEAHRIASREAAMAAARLEA